MENRYVPYTPIMRYALILIFAAAAAMVVAARAAQTPAPSDTVTIRAARLLDGKGGSRTNAVIEIRGSKITAIDQRKGPVTYDLGDVTLMPGMIDVHVHIDWHFQPNGLYGQRPGEPRETPEQRDKAIQANLDAMLDAGFTTVQSVGSPHDKMVRDAIEQGRIPGPRLLTSLGALTDASGSPEQIRQWIRQKVKEGADVVKLFATKSIRDGGGQSMTDAQIDAVCGE